jgi:hypothetical protein
VDDVDCERTEPVRRIETRFAHRTIADVEQVGELVGLAVVVERDVVVGDLVRLVVLAHPVVVGAAGGITLVADDLGSGAAADIEIPRQAKLRNEMRRRRPEIVVALDGRKRRLKPVAVLRLREHAEDHAGQKRRLRPAQEIRAIRIEHHAVLVDLVEEVLNHVPRELHLAVAKQADQDEITVPAVHLVEAAARNDIGMREVEETVLRDRQRVRRQRSQLDVGELRLGEHAGELTREPIAIFLRRHVNRPRLARLPGQLRIGRGGREVARRTAERGPAGLDVLPDLVDLLVGRKGLRGARGQGHYGKHHREYRLHAPVTVHRSLPDDDTIRPLHLEVPWP